MILSHVESNLAFLSISFEQQFKSIQTMNEEKKNRKRGKFYINLLSFFNNVLSYNKKTYIKIGALVRYMF